jgi:RND family efflux transporter MFP subunit
MKHLTLLLAIMACSDEAGSRSASPIRETASLAAGPVSDVTVAETVTVQVPLTLPSQLYVEHDATIYARSSGIVTSIRVDLGSPVVSGQLLARLESTDQEIALAQAREKFANTSRSAERQRELKRAGVVTVADSEQVEFEHRESVLALKKAQRDYDLTRILAPFAAVVTGRMTRLHHLVSPGDSLFRLTARKPILAAIHVPEAAAGKIGVGSLAEIIGADGGKAPARVIRASPVLDAGSGTRVMILQLTGAGPQLTPGSNVTVRLGLESRRVVTIPRAAVDGDGYALVRAGNKTTLRPVTLGAEIPGNRVEVVSGLAPGEQVVLTAP